MLFFDESSQSLVILNPSNITDFDFLIDEDGCSHFLIVDDDGDFL